MNPGSLDDQLFIQEEEFAASEEEEVLIGGLRYTADTLKANLPLNKIAGDPKILALESGSFLWASDIWDKMMNDALLFRKRTRQCTPQL